MKYNLTINIELVVKGRAVYNQRGGIDKNIFAEVVRIYVHTANSLC